MLTMAVSNFWLFTWLFLWGICVGDALGDTRTPLHQQCSIISHTRVKCSHLQLRSVPQSLPYTLEVFDLSYNNLTVLHNASFAKYNLIQILNVAHNFIQVLESGTFGNLLGLERLIFGNNSITEVPSTLFVNNTIISTLILSSNKIRRIPHWHGLCSNKKLHGNTTVSQYRNVTVIDFSHNNLTLIEEGDFAPFINCSIYKVVLGFNKLTSLPEKVFSEFSEVGKLDVSYIHLGKFEVRSFLGIKGIKEVSLEHSKIHSIIPLNDSIYISGGQFPEIKILKLKWNELKQIPDYALFGFAYLKILDLGQNRINAITNKSFCEARNLEVLNLSQNKIQFISSGTFACLSNLEYINFAFNSIYILEPAWFAGVVSLRNLDLHRCNINSIKDSSWNTTNLHIINLSANKLTHISRLSFTGLPRLQILRLSGNNQLYNIDSSAFRDLTALEVLEMGDISRFIVNGSFAEMGKLERLDCSFISIGIRFVSVHQFTHTSALQTLNMSHSSIDSDNLWNGITKKSLFVGLISLHTLRLRGNVLTNLPNVSWIFSPLIKMTLLDLTDCQLQVVSSEVFKNLTKLKELRLNNNMIVDISELAFQHLYNLRDLLLQFNKIESLEKNLFTGTVNLKRLYLQNNKISVVRPDTVIPTSLNRLNIAENSFSCTCELAWFTHWLRTTNINLEQVNKTLCSSASFKALVNQPVSLFDPKEYCGINVVLATGVTIAILAALFLCSLVYYKRWWFNHKIFLLKLAVCGFVEITEDADPGDYEYQLNLMFHEDDKAWVDNYMKPALVERMPHLGRVAFGDDDLSLGMYYLNALYDNIENSFKTALLISNQSVYDTWFMTKLRMAVEHVNDTKLDKIILIFLEDIQEANLPYLVRLLLSRNKPYLLVTNDEDGQDLFWAQFEKEMRANRAINSAIPT